MLLLKIDVKMIANCFGHKVLGKLYVFSVIRKYCGQVRIAGIAPSNDSSYLNIELVRVIFPVTCNPLNRNIKLSDSQIMQVTWI